jgi:hypothetical protein
LEKVGKDEREATFEMDRVLLELLPGPDSKGATPEELADRIGADYQTVYNQLGELYKSTSGVTATAEKDGTPRYRHEGDY